MVKGSYLPNFPGTSKKQSTKKTNSDATTQANSTFNKKGLLAAIKRNHYPILQNAALLFKYHALIAPVAKR
jgi:hypothetical protein